MNGNDALWQCGTDHAGIATQMVVERQLQQKNISRHELGREKFIDEVWNWKESSGNTINNQSRRLGTSMDWAIKGIALIKNSTPFFSYSLRGTIRVVGLPPIFISAEG